MRYVVLWVWEESGGFCFFCVLFFFLFFLDSSVNYFYFFVFKVREKNGGEMLDCELGRGVKIDSNVIEVMKYICVCFILLCVIINGKYLC